MGKPKVETESAVAHTVTLIGRMVDEGFVSSGFGSLGQPDDSLEYRRKFMETSRDLLNDGHRKWFLDWLAEKRKSELIVYFDEWLDIATSRGAKKTRVGLWTEAIRKHMHNKGERQTPEKFRNWWIDGTYEMDESD